MKRLTESYKKNTYGIPNEIGNSNICAINLPFGINFGGYVRYKTYVHKDILKEATNVFNSLNEHDYVFLLESGIINGYLGCFRFTDDLTQAYGISFKFLLKNNKEDIIEIFNINGFNCFYDGDYTTFEIKETLWRK